MARFEKEMGDAFRALPANDASVAVANAADTVALVEHGMCGGFSSER